MNKNQSPRIRLDGRRPRTLSVVIGGGALIGATLATLAAIYSSESENAEVEPQAIVEMAEPIVVTSIHEPLAPTASAPITVIDEVEEIEGKRPELAISHEDLDTDFEKLALEEIKKGEVVSALNALRKHIFVNEPNADVLMRIGRLGREAGELAIAEQALMDAGNLDPENAEVQIELSRLLLDAKDYEGARFAARQAIRIDADNPAAWNLAGRVAMSESQWHRAELAFRRAVELDPSAAMIHNNMGLLYIYMKEASHAVDSLETAVELYGEEAPHFVFNNLGLAYEMNEQFDESREAFEEALIQSPLYARAHVNLKRVEQKIEKLVEESATLVAEVTDAPGDPSEPSMPPAPSAPEEVGSSPDDESL